ncbi:MAG: tape measure protein, partial [Bacteroides sp.]
MTRMWGQVGSQIKSALSIYAVQSFVRQLITMGGEFEKQHYALRAIIGDLGKADQIFNNLRQVAVKSPFHFGDFTGFAKQLAAFSIPVNEIYDTTKRLADVSAGLGVDMGRIILAYGQIRAASFLRGQEVRQLTEAGIPIIEELAKKLTELKGVVVSTGEVFDSISRREVPFEMVKEVFQDLTDEGGKFYNMQEKLAESLSGKWANLTSYFQLMLYDISQEQNGALHALIETLTYLTKNFKLVQSAIYGMVTAFATAKVMHWVSAFSSMNMEAKRLLVTIRQLGRAILSTKGLMTAGAGLLTGILSYAYSKKAEYDKAINDIISTSYELENSISSNMKAFIELTKKEGESAEISAERHKILLDIAKTEPEVAKEIRAHANNTAFLTSKLKEYVAAQRAARDAELGFAGDSWFADTMEDTENDVKRAEDNIARLNINARKSFAELMRTLEGRELGEYMTDRYGSVWSEEIIMNLNKVLNDVNKTAEDKWREFNEIAYKYIKDVSGAGAASVFYQRISAFEYVQKKYADVSKVYADRIAEASVTISQSLENTLKQSNIKEGSEEYKRVVYESINNITSASDKSKNALYESFSIDPSVYEENTRALDGWKDELDKILNGIVTITKDTSVEDAISNVTSALKSTKEYISGIDEAKLRRAIDTQAEGWIVAEASLKELTKSKEDVKALNKAMEFLGAIEKMSGTKTKDAFADKMEQRVKLIKDANGMYEKYIALLGRADALERVRSDKRFAGLDFDPDNIESMLSDIYNQLNNSEAQKKVKDVITSMYTDIDFNKVKDSVNKMADGIKKLIKENADKFKLFDAIMEATGDTDMAKEMAFGSKDFADSYLDFLKGLLSDEVGAENMAGILGLDADVLRDNYSEPIIKLVEDIANETEKTRIESLKRQAEAIKETATIEEKANAIRLKYEKDIANAANERAADAMMDRMNKELSDLYMQAIQLSPVWRELFGDVSDYSYRMLKNLVSEAKKLVDTAEEVRDADGKGTGMFELTGSEGEKYPVKAEEYTRLLKAISKKSEEISQRNPFSAFAKSWQDFIDAPEGVGKEKALTRLLNTAGMAADEVANIASAFGDMFDALGNEELAETLELVGEITEAVGGIAQGFAQGGVVGGITASLSAIPKMIGSIARSHDRKLDRKIRKSALEVQRLQAAYERVNKEVERQLGAMTRSQVDSQISSLRKQVEETQYMMDKERKKKKSDQGKIDDYKNQIEELNDQILFFYEDLASNLYNIDIKGWANEFSNVILGAWRSGSDAAKAYEETANEVLANVANKMLAETVLEPVFKKLREQLPDMMDKGHLTEKDMGVLASLLVEVGDQIDKSFDYLD